MSKMHEQFVAARKFGVPLFACETQDPYETIRQLVKYLNGEKKHPALTWDIQRGVLPANEAGKEVLKRFAPNEAAAAELVNPSTMLARAVELPDKTVLFMHNAHRFYATGVNGSESIVQGIGNLRDPFKATGSMLVLLAPGHSLPPEIERDVLLTDEPLPSDAELGAIVKGVYAYAGLKQPQAQMEQQLVRAARGLAPFPAEQAVALSLSKDGANVAKLWELKRKMVEQTKGLTFYRGTETFDDIGGLQRIKQFSSLLFKGPQPPSCIVFVDEIDKGMAGAKGDTSGTSQDQHGTMLDTMEVMQWKGLICLGPPGCAKSLFAMTLANTFGVPCIRLDLGALKGSLVGQSEQQIRAAMNVIKAVAGDSAYWIATCNQLEVLAPEMIRRFTDGIWYFDLPDAEERSKIWTVRKAKHAITDVALPDDTDWTGADIRNVCSISYRLQVTLKQAATYITPVAKSNPESIEKLRKLADGAFLSASHEGVYKRSLSTASGRRVTL